MTFYEHKYLSVRNGSAMNRKNGKQQNISRFLTLPLFSPIVFYFGQKTLQHDDNSFPAESGF